MRLRIRAAGHLECSRRCWARPSGQRYRLLRRKVLVHQHATGGTVETLKGGEHRTLILAQYVIDELALTVREERRVTR